MTRVFVRRRVGPLSAAVLLGSAALAAPSFAQQPDASVATTVQTGSTGPGLDGLRREFPALLQAMQQTGAPALEAATPDQRGGRVKRGEFVWSSLPMRAGGQPVQRALRVDGGDVASPANPLVNVELPLDASSAFTVGEGAAGFAISPVAVQDGPHEVVGDGVLHEGTHADTDTLARAVTGGVETYELLGSSDSPERFSYRIEGAVPRQNGPEVVELIRDGRVVGRVTAPVVVDAAGQAVPASLAAEADHVAFTVAHRAAGVTYPVLADPLWTTDYTFANPAEGVEGLFFDHEPVAGPNHYAIAATNSSDASSPWRGITIRPNGGRTYQPGDIGRARFVAPPGARITKADFRGVYRRNDADRQTIRLALYGDGPPVVDDFSNTLQIRNDPSIELTDPTGSARTAEVWMATPPCVNGEANCPRSVATTNASRVSVDQLVVTLNDPGVPSVELGGSVAALGPEWRKGEGAYSLDIRASDNGSGIASWRVVQRQGANTRDELAAQATTCDPRHTTVGQEGLICPEVDGSTDVGIDLGLLREGRVRLQGEATDFAGNAQDGNGSPLELRLDRSSPELDPLGGPLLAGSTHRWTQLRGTSQVSLTARDTYSGVKSADVKIAWTDGADQQTVDLCQPGGTVDQPCPTEYEGTLPVVAEGLPDGELDVTATVRDQVGYESTEQSATVFKDNTNPAATARGALTDLEGEWTNSAEATAVQLEGKDRRSGVSRLELYATDADGRRLVDDITVCDPATIDASQPDGHCPKQVSRQASVDLGAFETGEVKLEAYATDAAGNRDPSPDSWETYLDYDPPTAVSRVNSITLNAETTRVSWSPASDEGSGVAGYEYRLEVGPGRFTDWIKTPYPGAQIPTFFEDGWIDIRARDRTGNVGPVQRSPQPKFGLGVRTGIVDVLEKIKNYSKGVAKEVWPVIGGFVCGEQGGVCKRVPGRDSVEWLVGTIASGVFVVGDIRDFFLAIPSGDSTAGLFAAAGLVPVVGDTGKAVKSIRSFMKRTKLPLGDAMAAVVRVTGRDSKLTERILDQLTGKGYGKLRGGGLSHEGTEQLVRAGNDIGKIAARARLARRPLSAVEREDVEANLLTFWKRDGAGPRGAFRAEALGVESAIKVLQRDPKIRILVSGRPDTRLSRAGPDIVAYDTAKNRLIVVEAKGTLQADSPLSLAKLRTENGQIQPSAPWLRAERSGPNDYMKKLKDSPNAGHNTAQKMLEELARGKRTKVDLKIVQVRPASEGTQAYGAGLDTATREIRDGGRVDDLEIVDVPY